MKWCNLILFMYNFLFDSGKSEASGKVEDREDTDEQDYSNGKDKY